MMNENILNLDLHPTKLAFCLYVIREYYTGPIEDIIFEPCDCKFAIRKAKWRSVFAANNQQLEFWIIFDQDEALAMVWRMIKDRAVVNFGMIHFELRPYDQDAVEEAIRALPLIQQQVH